MNQKWQALRFETQLEINEHWANFRFKSNELRAVARTVWQGLICDPELWEVL